MEDGSREQFDSLDENKNGTLDAQEVFNVLYCDVQAGEYT